MNKQRLAILIAACLGALATFLPWIKVPIIGTINGTKFNEGWISLVLFSVPLVISLFNDRTKAIKGRMLYAAILPSIIAGIIGIWKIIYFNVKISHDDNNPFAKLLSSVISIEFGLFLVVLAGIGLPLAAFIINDKERESL